MKGINLLIAIPALDTVDTNFFYSMIRMVQRHPEYHVKPEIDSEIWEAKDNLAFYAMHNKYDYICYIDADEEFHPEAIETLLKDGKEIVGGVCCKRAFPYEPMLYHYNDEMPYDPWEQMEVPGKEIIEADAFGGGSLLLIKVSTLRKIHNCTGDLFFHINHWSEDLSFFYRARQCGIQPYVDGRVRIGHRGKQTVTPNYREALYERSDH